MVDVTAKASQRKRDELAAHFQKAEPRWEKHRKKSRKHFERWRLRWHELQIIKQNRPLPDDINLEVLLWVDAETAGNSLGLTAEERSMWKIRTIRACDQTVEEAAAARKVKRRDSERTRRKANGATPRELAKSRLKPWVAEGVSRRTHYRRLAKFRGVAQIRGDYLPSNGGHAVVPSPDNAKAFPFTASLGYLLRLYQYRHLTSGKLVKAVPGLAACTELRRVAA